MLPGAVPLARLLANERAGSVGSGFEPCQSGAAAWEERLSPHNHPAKRGLGSGGSSTRFGFGGRTAKADNYEGLFCLTHMSWSIESRQSTKGRGSFQTLAIVLSILLPGGRAVAD